MKMKNLKHIKDTIIPGVSIVEVDNYNIAFRILTEF
jgi:hypothetical protein